MTEFLEVSINFGDGDGCCLSILDGEIIVHNSSRAFKLSNYPVKLRKEYRCKRTQQRKQTNIDQPTNQSTNHTFEEIYLF